MPYAADGKIAQEWFEGCIEITQEQYVDAFNGIMSGLAVTIVDGALHIGPPAQAEPEPEPEPDPTYQQDLAQLNAAYQADVDKLLRAFSLAYLADGTTQDAKQVAIRAQYFTRRDQHTNDLAALKAQWV